jgi:hypothetical protein
MITARVVVGSDITVPDPQGHCCGVAASIDLYIDLEEVGDSVSHSILGLTAYDPYQGYTFDSCG